MSLAQVLPEVQALTRSEKIRLIEVLAQELQQDDAARVEGGQSYPVWSPDQAFPAAATLLQELDEDRRQP